jgi:SAM-dependent methyltransferase
VESRVTDAPRARLWNRPGRWTVWQFNWLARHRVRLALERAARHARGLLVDLGCGWKPFEPLFGGRVSRYVGIDLPGSRDLSGFHPDVYARAETLPLRDGAADTVLAVAMLSYVPDPHAVIAEARRVLRPGGTLIVELVQMAPLHPWLRDYFRFTRHGAELLLDRAGFEPVEWLPVGGLWARVGLSMIGGLNRINRGPTRIITELPVRALYVVVQLVFDALDRLFFDPREMLSFVVVARAREAAAGASRASALPEASPSGRV